MTEAAAPEPGLLEQEGEYAADYLETLLDIADLDGDIDMDVRAGRATVSVIGTGLDVLVGPSGQTLEALQELTRLAVHQRTGARSRLVLDVGGYRAKRRAELAELARRVAEQARDSGEHVRLAPMSPFERKAIHDEIAALDGVMSESEGEEPQRCVIVKPAPGRTGTLPADIA